MFNLINTSYIENKKRELNGKYGTPSIHDPKTCAEWAIYNKNHDLLLSILTTNNPHLCKMEQHFIDHGVFNISILHVLITEGYEITQEALNKAVYHNLINTIKYAFQHRLNMNLYSMIHIAILCKHEEMALYILNNSALCTDIHELLLLACEQNMTSVASRIIKLYFPNN
jgi:hypothetical protein